MTTTSLQDLSEFKQTEYWEAVQNFQKFIVTEARTNGSSPERLGEAVHVALSTAKPKARYAVIPQRFKNWTLPRLLPERVLDSSSQRHSAHKAAANMNIALWLLQGLLAALFLATGSLKVFS